MAVEVKKGGKAPKIEQHVVVVEARPANVESADVSTWRSAVNSAKMGMRNSLFKLYENLMADGTLSVSIGKRTEAVTNAELVFINAQGEPDEEINALMDSVEFENLLTYIMEAQAWGISVIDVMSVLPSLKFYNVPRRNLNTAKKMVVTNEYDENGLAYADNPYLVEVINPNDPLGYIYKAAVYVIYKRGGFGDWTEFAEIFGMPFRAWKYSAYDTTVRDELIKALQMAGGKLNMVVPKEAELDQKEATSNSNGELFDKLIDRCEKEILITVLGETMTTVDGSSRSQSETHKDVSEDKNKADRRFVRRVLNSKILPVWELLGLPVTGGKFVFPEQGESLDTKTRVDIALNIRGKGIPVSDEYIYEVSGVRMPKDGETVSGGNQDDNDDPEDKTTDPKQPVPGKAKKKGTEATAMERFFGFFSEALRLGGAPLKF
jgi:phage gp29-like protein